MYKLTSLCILWVSVGLYCIFTSLEAIGVWIAGTFFLLIALALDAK